MSSPAETPPACAAPRLTAARTAHDELGPVQVPAGALWGAQTARSLQFFAIGAQPMPLPVVHAMAWVKWAAALAHQDLGLLAPERAAAIARAAADVATGTCDGAFPLSVWQTGSGTQSHMNVNEVVAHLATAALRADHGGAAGQAEVAEVDPHGEVNLGQSSNDVFPTAMHLAAALQVRDRLLPALDRLHTGLDSHAAAWADLVKVGRTHLQDAMPVTLGQEFGGYAAQLAGCRHSLLQAMPAVLSLALGGTAVGTGANSHPHLAGRVIQRLSEQLQMPLRQADNLFAALAGHEPLVALHAALKMLAIALVKVGNDIRLMGSGPRAGLGELHLPANEPGSAIMPGKVNPTQVEALVMVCAQVMGHDAAIGFAASQGQFELNACKPVIALDLLDSLVLLADAMDSFRTHCVAGLKPAPDRLAAGLQASLMLATALVPHIGHARTAQVVHQAEAQGSSLRAAALALDAVRPADFDAWMDPRQMLAPRAGGAPACPAEAGAGATRARNKRPAGPSRGV